MIQKIIKYYIVLIVVFLSWVNVAHAGVILNEIQISPTGDRFIELYNSGSSPVNLTDWYIQRKTAGGSTFGSLVSKTYFEGVEIGVNGYLIISRTSINNADIIVDDLTLTESNTIQLKKSSKEIIDSLEWGSISEGKSLQRNLDGEWTSATPTPGTANSSSVDSSDNPSENNRVDETLDPIPLIKEDPLAFKITTKIISPKTVVAGIPFSLSSLTTTNAGKTYNFGKFIWNFGDGMTKQVVKTEPFEYVYEYPGDYILSISYFDNSFTKVPDATDRIIIKVIPSDIYISGVGNDMDPYIELENKSNYEIVLSGWTIIAGIHGFIFPEGTNLLPGKKIKLSPKITGFTGEDIKLVFVMSPDKKIVSIYPDLAKKVTKNNLLINKVLPSNPTLIENNKEDDPLPKDSEIINLNDLEANASESGVNISNSSYPFILLFVIIGLGIASFLIIKKKKDVPDYVERGIRAEDMTILE